MGTTTLTNFQLLYPYAYGAGALRTMWTDPNGQFRGIYQTNKSDCMYLVNALVNPSTSPLGPKVKNYNQFSPFFDRYVKEYGEGLQKEKRQRDCGLMYTYRVVYQPIDTDGLMDFPVDSSNLGKILDPILWRGWKPTLRTGDLGDGGNSTNLTLSGEGNFDDKTSVVGSEALDIGVDMSSSSSSGNDSRVIETY